VWIARNKIILQKKLLRLNSYLKSGKETRCPLNRRLGQPHSWSVRFAEGEKYLAIKGIRNLNLPADG
jgi:hypothetical protein